MNKKIYTLLGLLLILATSTLEVARSADNIIVPKDAGRAFLRTNAGDLFPASVTYTTDGAGNVITMGGVTLVADNLIVPGNTGKAYLKDSLNRLFPASIAYTTDGNGNVIPISASGGGGGITSLNGLTAATQTFAVGTTGTNFGIVSSGSAHTFNLPTASASNRGLLSTADWSTFNAKQSALSFTSPLVNTAGTVALSGFIPFANIASLPQANNLWVDGSRVDSYVADGSLYRPYKTIMGAVNRVIANGDNGDSKKYQILVMGSQTYVENIVLENALLSDLLFECVGTPQSCKVTPASGNSLQSTSANNLLHFLILKGFIFDSPVVLSNPGGFNFLSNTGACYQCVFNSTQSVTNAGDWEVHDSTYAGDISLDGSVMFMTSSSSGAVNLSLVNGSIAVLDDAVLGGDVDIDSGSSIQMRGGARLGNDAGTVTNAGAMTLYPSFTRSAIVNSGTINLRGGNYRASTLTNTGTVNREVPLENYKSFTSGVVTCTGSSQNVAHGLGYVPEHVLVSAQDSTAAPVGYSIAEGAHDATNVVLTCTAGVTVKVMAF